MVVIRRDRCKGRVIPATRVARSLAATSVAACLAVTVAVAAPMPPGNGSTAAPPAAAADEVTLGGDDELIEAPVVPSWLGDGTIQAGRGALSGTGTDGDATDVTNAASSVATPWPWPSPLPTQPPAAGFRVTSFSVVRLAVGSRPYDANSPPPVAYHPTYHDANRVPMRLIDGHLVYKPAGLGQYAINALNGYRATGDPRYLAMAENVARVFFKIGRTSGGGLYIPYLFDFAMHRNPYDVIRKPWYSAMAQGLGLSLFTRLYQATGKLGYLVGARALFLSLRHIGRGTDPWVTYIDGSRYLWLEEYAQPYPEHTLNGFNFAAFGLYDYWLLTGDPTVLQEFRGAMTTLKANVMRYRNPGGPIDYCIKHGKPQIKYHEIVIAQLRFLSVITRDAYFSYAARVFASDA